VTYLFQLSLPTLFSPLTFSFLFSVQTYLFICQKKKNVHRVNLFYVELSLCFFTVVNNPSKSRDKLFFKCVITRHSYYARNSFKINILPPTFIRVNLKNLKDYNCVKKPVPFFCLLWNGLEIVLYKVAISYFFLLLFSLFFSFWFSICMAFSPSYDLVGF